MTLIAVLLYAVPCMAYLQLAQTDVPGHVEGLFIPVNPGTSVQLLYLLVKLFGSSVHTP